MEKKYSVGFFAAIMLCLIVLTVAYQLSYTKEEYEMKRQIREESVATEGNAKKAESFYLSELDGYLIVYREDKKTVYEYTSIEMDGLPENVAKEIRNGKTIRTAEELYGFLENYSS